MAVMTKMHHAAIDGVSGGEVLGVLLDPSPEGRELPPAPAASTPRPVPGDVELLARTMLGMPLLPLRAVRALPRTLPHLDQVTTVRAFPGVRQVASVSARVLSPRADGGVLERPALRAPRTRFNGRISAHRRFAFASLPIADVKALKDHLGITVNDVVMALCAGALRRRLEACGELPAAPLLTMIPVSVRTPEQAGGFYRYSYPRSSEEGEEWESQWDEGEPEPLKEMRQSSQL